MSKRPYRDAYLEPAIEDLVEIERFYDAQAPGLGTEFSEAVTARLDLVLEFPESAAVFEEGEVRRVSVGGFPYYIVYKIVEEFVYIIAVVHKQRHPRHWLSRLKLFD